MLKKLETGFQKMVLILTTFFLGLSLVSSVRKVPAGTKFLTSQIGTPQLVVCLIAVFILFFLIVSQYVIKLQEGSWQWMIRLILLAGMLTAQVLLVLKLNVIHINDDFYVQDAAAQIVYGAKDKIDTSGGGYFAVYSNNDLAVLLTILVYKISLLIKLPDVELGLTILNLICIDTSILFLVLAVKEWKGVTAADITFLYCVLNPLNYILIHWTYTPTYSLPLMTGILYLSINICRKQNSKFFFVKNAIFGIFCAVGFYLRPTVLIPAIAVGICFLIRPEVWMKKCKRWILGFFVLVIAAAGTRGFIKNQINQTFEEREETLYPLTHWLMIGMGDGYDYSYQAYTKSFPTREEKIEGNLKRIKEMLQEYGTSGALNHFLTKIPVCWDDGLMSGAGRNTYISEYSPIYQWIGGEKTDALSVYAQGFRVATLLLITCSVIRQLLAKKKNRILFLFTLSLFGGMLFYCFWETKGAYGIPFVPIMLVIAQEETEHIRIRKKPFLILLLITLICFVLLWVRMYKPVVQVPFRQTVRTVWHAAGDVSGLTGISSEGKTVTQEFYANHSFENIGLRVNIVDGISCYYSVRLLKNDEIIKTWNVSEKQVNKGWIYLGIEKTIDPSIEPYLLEIRGATEGQADSLVWMHNISAGYDDYPGKAVIDDSQVAYDFQLKVYTWAELPYMGGIKYFFILACILAIYMMFGISAWQIFEKR